MTILSVVGLCCPRLSLEIPTTFIGQSRPEYVEILEIANEMAEVIAKAHDWRALTTLKTMTGDGTTEAFALPTDYDRMITDAKVWSSSLESSLTHISSLDKWLELDIQSFDFVINAWTLIGGNMEIKPALASAVTAKYYYQSNLVVSPATGDNKTSFTLDTDTYRLPERLLKLGIIWQWKSAKGLPYAKEEDAYNAAMEQEIARDKGSRMIRIGKVRLPSDVSIAYPQAIVP